MTDWYQPPLDYYRPTTAEEKFRWSYHRKGDPRCNLWSCGAKTHEPDYVWTPKPQPQLTPRESIEDGLERILGVLVFVGLLMILGLASPKGIAIGNALASMYGPHR
jgi:hypothetical protein